MAHGTTVTVRSTVVCGDLLCHAPSTFFQAGSSGVYQQKAQHLLPVRRRAHTLAAGAHLNKIILFVCTTSPALSRQT
jgi:hypothetical protein